MPVAGRRASRYRSRMPSGKTWSIAGLVLAQLYVGGCDRLSPPDKTSPAPGASGPVTVTWVDPGKLRVEGTQGEATFLLTKDADKPPLRLVFSLSDFPVGTKVKVGSEAGLVGASGSFSSLCDVTSVFVDQTLDDVRGKVDLKVPITIEITGSALVTTELPKQTVKDGVRAALLRARDGGFTLGPTDKAQGKPRGAALLSGSSDVEFIGTAKTLLEVDWVAVGEEPERPRASKSCNFKEGPITVELFDAKTTIVERRSGRKVAEKVILARNECPKFALIDMTNRSAKRSADKDDLVAWVRRELGAAR
jgi:hypothetical protein